MSKEVWKERIHNGLIGRVECACKIDCSNVLLDNTKSKQAWEQVTTKKKEKEKTKDQVRTRVWPELCSCLFFFLQRTVASPVGAR